MVAFQVPAAAASPDKNSRSQLIPLGVENQSVLARLNTVENVAPVSCVPITPGIRPADSISRQRASSSLKLEGTAQPFSSISVLL